MVFMKATSRHFRGEEPLKKMLLALLAVVLMTTASPAFAPPPTRTVDAAFQTGPFGCPGMPPVIGLSVTKRAGVTTGIWTMGGSVGENGTISKGHITPSNGKFTLMGLENFVGSGCPGRVGATVTITGTNCGPMTTVTFSSSVPEGPVIFTESVVCT